MSRRKTPYTAIGIRRLKCFRCGEQASVQWQVCADNNVFRPLCSKCDVELNRLVLEWMRHPEVEALMAKYKPQ